MCGIVGYIGKKDAYPIIIKGLRRLEYRGYDSAGVALLNGNLNIYKKKGKVQDLVDFIDDNNTSGSIGMGHTRWATHGAPNDTNAHPHLSQNKRLAIIHNGIIENYESIKQWLETRGHSFASETDTEILIHLIEEILNEEDCSTEEAVRIALNKVIGAYAIVIIDRLNPKKLVAARKSSPLVIGLGKEEYFIASDATPIVEYTNQVVYLDDDEIAVLSLKDGLQISKTDKTVISPSILEINLKIESIEKGGYDFFMLKEIYEQPKTISNGTRGRFNAQEGWTRLGGIDKFNNKIINANRIIIVACGTSWHSGLIAEYMFEDLARIPVEVEYASEFRYRNPIITEKDVVIAISQSGETADTLAALELAKQKGALTYGICNVVGSSIARITDAGSYIHAGPEIGVASTKAFTGQVTILALMALHLANKKGTISETRYRTLLAELENIPQKVAKALETDAVVKQIANKVKNSNNALYLGRGYNFPVALEGALKLKEISYIHAEGYPAAEMKHGPIALIDENMPIFVIATNQSAYEKIVSNVQEVKARKGKVIAVVLEGDTQIKKLADYIIEIPETDEVFSPLISVIPLQLLSYHIAVMRGCNVDQPRNLAKSVTVE